MDHGWDHGSIIGAQAKQPPPHCEQISAGLLLFKGNYEIVSFFIFIPFRYVFAFFARAGGVSVYLQLIPTWSIWGGGDKAGRWVRYQPLRSHRDGMLDGVWCLLHHCVTHDYIFQESKARQGRVKENELKKSKGVPRIEWNLTWLRNHISSS